MEEIHFFCVICGESLTADASGAGGLCDCPRCQRVVPIPGFPAQPGTSNCLGAFSERILKIEIKFLCEHCGAKLREDARYQGQSFPCPACEAQTKVPEFAILPPEIPGSEGAVRPPPLGGLSADEREYLSTHLTEDRADAGLPGHGQ